MDRADLDAFLRRIGLESVEPGTLETLDAVIEGFTQHVPFEQLDCALGRRISADSRVIFEKIVTHNRGGFCFENNTLMHDVLKALDFNVTRHAGRVVVGGAIQGVTHLFNTVQLDQKYVVDVGFGGSSLRRAVPLVMDEPQLCYPDVVRFVEDTEYVSRGIKMQSYNKKWIDQWASCLEDPVFDIDVHQRTFAVSCKPDKDNWFTNGRLVALFTPRGKKYIIKNTFHVHERQSHDDLAELGFDYETTGVEPIKKTQEDIPKDDYLDLLQREFNIKLDWDPQTVHPHDFYHNGPSGESKQVTYDDFLPHTL